MATQPHHDEHLPDEICGVAYEELSPEESREMFERNAQEWLGMTGDEFIRRWDAGDVDDLNHTDVVMLSLMLPLAR